MLAPLRAVLSRRARSARRTLVGDHRDLMPLDSRGGPSHNHTPIHCRDLSDRPKLARVLLSLTMLDLSGRGYSRLWAVDLG